MSTIEVFFPHIDEGLSEILIAELAMLDFDPFWQDEDGLRAYINAEKLNENRLNDLICKYAAGSPLKYKVQLTIPNAWERVQDRANQPLIISNKLTVYDHRTGDLIQTPLSICLSAQMAFGDGRHPSTELSLELMLEMDFKAKWVVDVGTGSAILATLAEKMGAAKVLAFDNNPWAIEVAQKTLEMNECTSIQLEQWQIEDDLNIPNNFDIILANLNFQVLKNHFSHVVRLGKTGSLMLMSGITSEDINVLMEIARLAGAREIQRRAKNEWIAVLFSIEANQHVFLKKY